MSCLQVFVRCDALPKDPVKLKKLLNVAIQSGFMEGLSVLLDPTSTAESAAEFAGYAARNRAQKEIEVQYGIFQKKLLSACENGNESLVAQLLTSIPIGDASLTNNDKSNHLYYTSLVGCLVSKCNVLPTELGYRAKNSYLPGSDEFQARHSCLEMLVRHGAPIQGVVKDGITIALETSCMSCLQVFVRCDAVPKDPVKLKELMDLAIKHGCVEQLSVFKDTLFPSSQARNNINVDSKMNQFVQIELGIVFDAARQGDIARVCEIVESVSLSSLQSNMSRLLCQLMEYCESEETEFLHFSCTVRNFFRERHVCIQLLLNFFFRSTTTTVEPSLIETLIKLAIKNGCAACLEQLFAFDRAIPSIKAAVYASGNVVCQQIFHSFTTPSTPFTIGSFLFPSASNRDPHGEDLVNAAPPSYDTLFADLAISPSAPPLNQPILTLSEVPLDEPPSYTTTSS